MTRTWIATIGVLSAVSVGAWLGCAPTGAPPSDAAASGCGSPYYGNQTSRTVQAGDCYRNASIQPTVNIGSTAKVCVTCVEGAIVTNNCGLSGQVFRPISLDQYAKVTGEAFLEVGQSLCFDYAAPVIGYQTTVDIGNGTIRVDSTAPWGGGGSDALGLRTQDYSSYYR